jgi:UDP-N-acetylmuramate dehydrogenase
MPRARERVEAAMEPLEAFARREEPLARHVTMRVGGAAHWWVEPQNEAELIAGLKAVQRAGLRLQMLGGGSNLVPSDDGFEGAVLKLGQGFAGYRVEGDRLIAGGAAKLPKLTHVALQHQLGNFEWACGVPGEVGGSVWGNAGARGWNGHDFESRDAAADLEAVVAFNRAGNRYELLREDLEFSYRKSSLGDLIVTQATFRLQPLDEKAAAAHREVVRELLARRKATQPVNAASAGCVWKNPQVEGCRGAGALIEKLGLKEWRVGGAAISAVHGNFVINTGEATGGEVRELIARVEAKVWEETGIRLEREVRLLHA